MSVAGGMGIDNLADAADGGVEGGGMLFDGGGGFVFVDDGGKKVGSRMEVSSVKKGIVWEEPGERV